MDTDDMTVQCSARLHNELESRLAQELFDTRTTRPVLKHLNADSSWLLSLPYPKHLQPPPGRCRYNIVIDAWLQGSQVDFFPWFSSQEHAQPSSIQSLRTLNTLLGCAELAVTGLAPPVETYFIDAICCSHEFTDHCHETTLKEVPASVPVVATRKAAALIRSWQYFEKVIDVPEYSRSRHHEQAILQPWINLYRVCTKGDGPAYLHSALIFSYNLDIDPPAEVVIYAPHGIQLEVLKPALIPGDNIVALLHGLHDISLAGSQLNLGRDNALKITQALRVAHWLPTHDEVKIAHGLVAYLLKRTSHTLEIAPGAHPITGCDAYLSEPYHKSFADVGNGEYLVIDYQAHK